MIEQTFNVSDVPNALSLSLSQTVNDDMIQCIRQGRLGMKASSRSRDAMGDRVCGHCLTIFDDKVMWDAGYRTQGAPVGSSNSIRRLPRNVPYKRIVPVASETDTHLIVE